MKETNWKNMKTKYEKENMSFKEVRTNLLPEISLISSIEGIKSGNFSTDLSSSLFFNLNSRNSFGQIGIFGQTVLSGQSQGES